MKNFTITDISKNVFAVLAQHGQQLLTSLAIPFLLLFSVGIALSDGQSNAITLPFALLISAIQGIVALITHRISLAPDTVPTLGLNQFTMREGIFLVYFVGIFGSINALQEMVFNLVGPLTFLLMAVVIIWVLSRISLTFPALAVGDYVPLRSSWEMTKPFQRPMLMVVVVFPVVVSILLAPFVLLLPALLVLVQPLVTVVTIVALSLTYAHIRASQSSSEQ